MSDHSCCQNHDHGHDHDHSHAVKNGVENPGVLDALGRDGETGEVVLVMLEPRPWNGGETQLIQLQEKLNSYLSFALDGEMVEQLPQLVGVPVRIQLACAEPPPEPVVKLLEKVREQISFQGVGLAVSGLGGQAGCDGSGGCGSGECGSGECEEHEHEESATVARDGGGGCGSGCGCH